MGALYSAIAGYIIIDGIKERFAPAQSMSILIVSEP